MINMLPDSEVWIDDWGDVCWWRHPLISEYLIDRPFLESDVRPFRWMILA